MDKKIKKRDILMAFVFGFFMWIMMEVFPLFFSTQKPATTRLVVSFFAWMVGGFIFSYLNRKSHWNMLQSVEEQKKKLEELDKNIEHIDYMKDSNPDDFLKNEKWVKNES